MIISEVTAVARQPWIENALLKALARAFRWRRMIESGPSGLFLLRGTKARTWFGWPSSPRRLVGQAHY